METFSVAIETGHAAFDGSAELARILRELKDGRAMIVSDRWMDWYDALDIEPFVRSVLNADRVGTLDTCIAWIGGETHPNIRPVKTDNRGRVYARLIP